MGEWVGVDLGEAGAACLPGSGNRHWGGGGGASVVLDGGQLGVQVHADVLVEAAEGNDGTVAEVVEAVQVLALFGIPQQFIPAQVTHTPH